MDRTPHLWAGGYEEVREGEDKGGLPGSSLGIGGGEGFIL